MVAKVSRPDLHRVDAEQMCIAGRCVGTHYVDIINNDTSEWAPKLHLPEKKLPKI